MTAIAMAVTLLINSLRSDGAPISAQSRGRRGCDRIPEVAFTKRTVLSVRQGRQDRNILNEPSRLDCAVRIARPGEVAEPVRVARPSEVRPGGNELV